MSIEQFKKFKEKFNTVVPIRGRPTEIKPIGDRRRCWETVAKAWVVPPAALDMEGFECYGAHLYNTDCVLYAPDGDIYLQANGYVTPTTAEFMSRYLPYGLITYKKYNKLWIDGQKLGGAFVLNREGKTILRFNPDSDTYTIDNPEKVVQKVIDRTKSKEARSKVKEFRDFVRIMLKMSDGWIRNEMVDKYATYENWGRVNDKVKEVVMEDGAPKEVTHTFNHYDLAGSLHETTAKTLYRMMQSNDNEMMVQMLCLVVEGVNYEERITVRTEQYETTWNNKTQMHDRDIYEKRYKVDSVIRRIDFVVKAACDIHTTKEVEAGKVMTNLL